MKRILQLSTYPINNPLHGGQIRVSQIKIFFEQHDCKVKSLSLSEMSHESYSEDDCLLNGSELQALVNVPFCTDYATSLLCTAGKYFKFLQENILDFNPDIILVEQVWLWPAVKKLQQNKLLSNEIQIVYSSQNIEYKTKKSLLASHGISGKNVDNVIKSIYELEQDLCREAYSVIACTKIDASEFTIMGAKQTVIANNGVVKRDVNTESTQMLKDILLGRRYVLFVGSAYPPNAQGFWDMMGSSMAFLPPDTIIVVAGGVSKIIENYMPESAKLYSYVSMDRIKRLGFVSEELLGTLVENASVIILPITVGGGSNLKTAEAIASGRPVVATETACRGFDFVDKLSNFFVAKDDTEFISSITNFLNFELKNVFSEEEKDLRKSVYWENCIQPLNLLLSNIYAQ